MRRGLGSGVHTCCGNWLSRRQLLRLGTMLPATAEFTATALGTPTATFGTPPKQPPVRLPLRVQPVLVYEFYKRVPERSWRPWGGLMTPQDVAEEKDRIGRELEHLKQVAEFPLEFLPLAEISRADQVSKLSTLEFDSLLIYAASGGVQVYEALNRLGKWNLIFVRHRSGPVYLWYEIVHPRLLRKTVDEYGEPGLGPDDVVVDELADLVWRLRALAALKNTVGKRIVCVGGPSGWGKGGQMAPARTRTVFQMELVTVSYEELAKRIEAARQDPDRVQQARQQASDYLRDPDVRLETERAFVENAFLLTGVFHDLLAEHQTDAITINHCMTAIMPVGKTTACLPLSLLNDAGYLAFCESDFVVIPSGVLLHYVAGQPVFLNDPTYPHHGLVTLAHCTAPRCMDGHHPEPVRILTHFESDYGAAPKVQMRKGQVVTNLVPDFNFERWIGFTGEIVDTPFLAICRSQIDVSIRGDWQRLVHQMRGFHWMTCYGDWVRETGYALRRLGLKFETL